MTPGLPAGWLDHLASRVEQANAEHARAYPGAGRQPVHTVYVAADRFRADTAISYGQQALGLLDRHAPTGDALAVAVGLTDAGIGERVRDRVAAKLRREPVEDLRVDFEDGYGIRDDATEDRDAIAAARSVTDAAAQAILPRRFGVRLKPFTDGMHARSIRTLAVFLQALDPPPKGLVITLPKIVAIEHVAVFAEVLGRLEETIDASLRFEVQIETTESVLLLDRIRDAAGGRLSGAHFGVFDYTAAIGLPPAGQRLDHPACDYARHVMQTTLAGTGVELSDGSTNLVPHSDDTAVVHRAWRLHADHVRHSLRHGFRQGWDLHPAQLPSRYAAVYGFYLDGLEEIVDRIRAWRDARTPAHPGGREDLIDEPATIAVLARHVQHAVDAGAVDADAVVTGLGSSA